MSLSYLNSTTNLENISETNNTHEGHCSCRLQKIALYNNVEGEKEVHII